MSELIARLLDEETDLADCAVDRIEELVEENKELTLQLLAVHGQAAEALDRAVAAEAKLAKAMAGLRKIADHKHFSRDQGWTQNAEARIASAVLAELEGMK